MNRRKLLIGAGLSVVGTRLEAERAPLQIELDGVVFQGWHREGRLHCTFTAPTHGWLAVGFNSQQRFKNTRMVMGAMIGAEVRVEEHIAVVPAHPTIQDLGLVAAVRDVDLQVQNGTSSLRFSLPHQFTDTDNPELLPGRSTYLMLAWSQDVDFAHHSAWRRHFSILL